MSGFDYEALAVFVRLGFFLGDTTAWSDHQATAPPGINDAAKKTLWDAPEPVSPVPGRSRAELIEIYIELFRQAVSRTLPAEPFALPLSGGEDSRHILLELVRQGRPPRLTLTVAQTAIDQDVPIARELSEQVAVPHKVLPAQLSYHAELEKNELTGFQADAHAWVPVLARALRKLTREAFDGIGGGLISAGLMLSPERRKLANDPEQLAEHLMWPEEALRGALAPDLYELVPRDLAKSAIIAEYERWRHEPNPVGVFLLRNQTARETALAPFTLMHPTVMHTPFLDPDLVSFVRSIPVEEFAGQTLHREVIHTAFPASRHIPFDKDRLLPARRLLPHKSYDMAKAIQLVLEAAKSPRLSKRGALFTVWRRIVWPLGFAKRMAWIAQLPTAPGTGVTARSHIAENQSRPGELIAEPEG